MLALIRGVPMLMVEAQSGPRLGVLCRELGGMSLHSAPLAGKVE